MQWTKVIPVVVLLLAAGIYVKAQAVAPMAAAKVVVFNTEALTDEKAGVTRLVSAIKAVDANFKKQGDDLNVLRSQIVALEKEITDNQSKWPPDTLREKTDQYEQLKRKFQFDGEGVKKAYEKAIQTATDPIYKDMNTALQAFAKQRGVDLLIDLSKFAGALMILNNAMDITDAFIKDYNAKNAGVPVK